MTDINQLVETINKGYRKIREDHEALTKKYDGVLNDQFKGLSDQISGLEKKQADLIREVDAVRAQSDAQLKFHRADTTRGFSKAYKEFLKTGKMDGFETKDIEIGTVGVSESGGILVKPEERGMFWDNLRQTSTFRQEALVVTTDKPAISFSVQADHFGAGWVAEDGTRNVTSTATYKNLNIGLHGLYARPQISNWALNDIDAMNEEYIIGEVNKEFAYYENQAFVAGNGTTEPKGLLTYSAVSASVNYEFGKLGHYTAAASATVTFDDCVFLKYSLKPEFRTGAVFMLNDTTAASLRTLKQNETYLWGDVTANTPATILGSRVVFNNYMPNVASGAKPIVYGDFKQGYVIADSTMMVQVRDPYTNPGYVRLYTEKRTGGGVKTFDAFKIMVMA